MKKIPVNTMLHVTYMLVNFPLNNVIVI